MLNAASENQSSARTFLSDSQTMPWITASESEAAAAMDQRTVIRLMITVQASAAGSHNDYLLRPAQSSDV